MTTKPANRRLAMFRDEARLHREAGAEGLSLPRLARSWNQRNDFADGVTDAEYERSRKVLARLAALS